MRKHMPLWILLWRIVRRGWNWARSNSREIPLRVRFMPAAYLPAILGECVTVSNLSLYYLGYWFPCLQRLYPWRQVFFSRISDSILISDIIHPYLLLISQYMLPSSSYARVDFGRGGGFYMTRGWSSSSLLVVIVRPLFARHYSFVW